jgi:PAS domain S-box-containing protein
MPLSVHGRFKLSDLIEPRHVCALLRKLSTVTGVHASLIDRDGNSLFGDPANSGLCPTSRRTRGHAACQEFYTRLCRQASESGQAVQSICPFDLTVGLAPICIEQQVLAHLKCGHVFHDLPTPSRICHLAEFLQTEVEPYREEIMKQRVMPDSDFKAVMELGWEIAQTISRAAHRNLSEKLLEARLQPYPDDLDPALGEPLMESRASRERYRRLFEHAPLVAYSLDSQLRTLYISPYCHKVFGYQDQEVQEDLNFWDRHIHPQDRTWVHREREHHLRRGEAFTLEYRTIHRNNSVRHIINHTIPVARDQELQYIDGFIFDITARKRLEEQQVLTEKIKVLSDMSLSVAHEIRNPLTSVGGFARLLDRRMPADDPNRFHLEIILKEVARLEATLNRVLDDFKPVRLQPEPSDVNRILARILSQLHCEFLKRGIRLSTNLSTDIPHIDLDRTLIEQALRSIIELALRDLAQGHELNIVTSLNKLHIIIEINGIYVDYEPGEDSQLFFPFYRQPAFGSSFGLPLSQQIITEHGGNVVFRNGFERQPSLLITLPLTGGR